MDGKTSHIIGHKQQLEQFDCLIRSNNIPHALLLSGLPSIGKRVVARHFAQTLLAKNGELSDTARNQICAGSYPDLHLIYREADRKDIRAETIRELCQRVRLCPFHGYRSIVIIDEAHYMNPAAANALLLTLEEPPAHVIFLLISSSAQNIPETIASRCQWMHFAPLSTLEISTLLEKLVGNNLEPAQRNILAQLSLGSLELLGLSRFVSDNSLQLASTPELIEELKGLAQTYATLTKDIAQIPKSPEAAQSALALAAELAQRFEHDPRLWRLIEAALREQMRVDSCGTSALWADALMRCVEKERWAAQRSAHVGLQLADLFLSLCQPRGLSEGDSLQNLST